MEALQWEWAVAVQWQAATQRRAPSVRWLCTVRARLAVRLPGVERVELVQLTNRQNSKQGRLNPFEVWVGGADGAAGDGQVRCLLASLLGRP